MLFLWNVLKQNRVSFSTVQAKYIAPSECSSDVKRILNYTGELGISDMPYSRLRSNNTASEVWAEGGSGMKKAKHT